MEDLDQNWRLLTESLRAELEEYGALCQLLGEQQSKILARDAEGVLQDNARVETQAAECDQARKHREAVAARLAESLSAPKETTVRELLVEAPDRCRFIAQPLVEEINATIERARRKAGQNHLLLGRACRLMEELIDQVQPGKLTKTYTKKGIVNLKTQASGSQMRQVV